MRQPLGFGEALVADRQVAGLIKPSVLKPVFTTIDQGLVVRALFMNRPVRTRMPGGVGRAG